MNKRLQTVAAMACMKTLLMLFNFVFWLTGIAILGVGIWLEVELYKYMELSSEFSRSAPYVLLGAGALIVIVSSLACCCTAKGQPVLLYIYGTFLMVIFILEVAAAFSIYAYRGHLQAGFDRGLNKALEDYDTDPEKKNCFDFMQTTLHCCGIRNYTDWQDKVPTTCCKLNSCDTSDVSEIYTQGCYTLVVDFLNTNIGVVAGSAAGVAVIPLLGVLLSCCLARNINKAKYEQMA